MTVELTERARLSDPGRSARLRQWARLERNRAQAAGRVIAIEHDMTAFRADVEEATELELNAARREIMLEGGVALPDLVTSA